MKKYLKFYFKLLFVKAVPYGRNCTVDGECRITLGQTTSGCNKTTGRCDCFVLTGEEAAFLDGRCYKVKSLGEACTEDGQCILGSNDLGRCVNETCQCYSDDKVTLVPGTDGFCQLEPITACPDSSTDISVFAVTAAGSVALFVVIVLIYQTTRTGR